MTEPQTPAPTKPRKIALIGYAPNVRMAPWTDQSYEIWGLNDQPWTMPRIDVLFEIHSPDVIKAEGHWDRLKTLQVPVYMQDHYQEIPSSLRYPMELVNQAFTVPGTDRPFLTCSASLMLAVALLSAPRPEVIDIYGIDMAQSHEYREQRPSCEFFLGIAYGLGIKVSVQHSSDLLKTRFIYGFEEATSAAWQQQLAERKKWLSDMHQQAIMEENTAKEKRLQYLGALSDIDHVITRWSNPT